MKVSKAVLCDICKKVIAERKCYLCKKDVCEGHGFGLDMQKYSDGVLLRFSRGQILSDISFCQNCSDEIIKILTKKMNEKNEDGVYEFRNHFLEKFIELLKVNIVAEKV
jgi:hypothetical protein